MPVLHFAPGARRCARRSFVEGKHLWGPSRTGRGRERLLEGGTTVSSVLRSYWHPVATAAALGDGPLAVQLLGEQVVLYRANGTVIAFQDLCIHRGTRLSLGSVRGENLVCAYHGWTYGPSGACVLIPSQPEGVAIPAKARARAYRAEQRYGLIWVCLEEPAAPIPEFPRPDFPQYGAEGTHAHMMEFEWDVNPARMTENSMDHSHFPFVHPGVLGDPSRPVYPDVQLEVLDDGMRYDIENHANDSVRHYRVTLPFTLEISVNDKANPTRRKSQLFTCCPISPKRTRHWFISIRNHDLETPDDGYFKRDTAVFSQDRHIVENQHPEELPLDIREELHLKRADIAALQYRRMLDDLGVRW